MPLSTNFLNNSLISILLGKTGGTTGVGAAGGIKEIGTDSNFGVLGSKDIVVAENIHENINKY